MREVFSFMTWNKYITDIVAALMFVLYEKIVIALLSKLAVIDRPNRGCFIHYYNR